MPARTDITVGCKVIPLGCNVPVGATVPHCGIHRWLTSHLSRQTISLKDSHPWKKINLAQTNQFEITISTDPSHEIIPNYGSILEEMSVHGEVA